MFPGSTPLPTTESLRVSSNFWVLKNLAQTQSKICQAINTGNGPYRNANPVMFVPRSLTHRGARGGRWDLVGFQDTDPKLANP